MSNGSFFHSFVFLKCKFLDFFNYYRNTKWKFLDGVKNSGAPPPRSVIVQQCIRDLNVLKALCDYVSSCFALTLSVSD